VSKYVVQNDSVCIMWEKGMSHHVAYLIPTNIPQGMIWLSLRP